MKLFVKVIKALGPIICHTAQPDNVTYPALTLPPLGIHNSLWITHPGTKTAQKINELIKHHIWSFTKSQIKKLFLKTHSTGNTRFPREAPKLRMATNQIKHAQLAAKIWQFWYLCQMFQFSHQKGYNLSRWNVHATTYPASQNYTSRMTARSAKVFPDTSSPNNSNQAQQDCSSLSNPLWMASRCLSLLAYSSNSFATSRMMIYPPPSPRTSSTSSQLLPTVVQLPYSCHASYPLFFSFRSLKVGF